MIANVVATLALFYLPGVIMTIGLAEEAEEEPSVVAFMAIFWPLFGAIAVYRGGRKFFKR